jgi:hypothetical protein
MNFATLTNYRSGSSFFQRLLNSHPDIGAAQEMLAGPITRGKNLRNVLAGFYTGKKSKALGFKLMYSHIRGKLMEHLEEFNVKIIHYIREDLLETVALLPQCFEGKYEGGLGPPLVIKSPLRAKIGTIINEIKRLRGNIEKYSEYADFVVTYNQTTGGKGGQNFHDEEMEKLLLEFLGVKYKRLYSDVNKKNKRPPLEDVFTNWEGLIKEIRKRKIERYYRAT